MTAEAWVSVGVVAAVIVALLLDRFSPDLVLFLAKSAFWRALPPSS